MVSPKEERLSVTGPAGKLDVVLRFPAHDHPRLAGDYCAVVCHPNPQQGGTMDNKVVTTLVRTFLDLGVPAVRFNFRGVGGSEGVHDHGVGEVDDLRAVAAWARQRTGATKLLLAGFSFGTGVVSNGCRMIENVALVVFVAPPVGRYNFSAVDSYPCPLCIVMGDRDELVDAAEVYRWAESLDPLPRIVSMPEATHFFHGQLVQMRELLTNAIISSLE